MEEREEPPEDPGAPGPEQAEGGAESYGGDADSEPSVSEDEVDRGMERDQAEG